MSTGQFPNLGKYRVLGVLGQGRFATVYRVEDTVMGRLGAAKVFDAALVQDELWVARLQDKVRALARLQHPHIVPVYEVGETDGRPYMVMQLARDGSLAQTINAHSGQSVPWAKALAFLKSVCEAVNYAHEQGSAHGDLKPGNILIDPPGGPLVMDFGLTYLMAGNQVGLTRIDGGVIGTLPYIAPEVWETEPPEIPADIYALGCITYEMLLGQPLFAGDSVMQAMHAHAQGPQFPSAWPSDVPPGIVDVLKKALAWDKTTRYSTPLAFWNALNGLGMQVSTGAQLAAVAAQWKTKAEAAIQSGKLQIAKMAVSQWLAAEPDSPEALKAREIIDRMATPPAPAPQPQPAVTHPQPAAQPTPQPAPQVVAQPTPQPVVAQPTPQPVAPPPQPAPQVAPQPIVPPPQPAPQPIPVPQLFTFMTLPDQQTGILVNQYTVEQFLSTEGQSNTYAAEINGQAVTLRWYFPAEATSERRAGFEAQIKQGAPSPHFLWPTRLVESPLAAGFGYITPPHPAHFKSLEELAKRWTEPTFYVLMTTMLNLVDSFIALHMRGLCYYALSPRNVFFDPDVGTVALAYHDNIGAVGEMRASADSAVLPFMAPEIVREEAAPSVQTDLHSLAVLLFYGLMIHHPLAGEKLTHTPVLDAAAIKRLYGTEPIFIFDPNNTTNHPVPGYHVGVQDYWPLYPQALRDMFTRAFTAGLVDPYNGRIRETEWRKVLVQLRDTIIYCPQCSAENFYDLSTLKSTGKLGTCWSCHGDLVLPPRLKVGDSIVMLNYNTKLYPHHVDPDRRYDFSQPVAEVTQHPQNPHIWGLRNLSAEKWVITAADGSIKDVAPTRSLTLSAGVKISFGKQEGEIRV